MHERITISLSEESIGKAIRRVEALAKAQSERIDDICRRYAEAIRDKAQTYFNEAWIDSTVHSEKRRNAEVDVRVEQTPGGYKVVAFGEDAVWVEFGTGVTFNGSAGQSPHPKGAEHGFLIGGYGKGKGKQAAWGFIDESGDLVITRGTEAQMPLYRAFSEILQEGIR